MNEREWLRAREPEQMLAAVQDRLSQRKWVLLNCAVARRMAEAIEFPIISGSVDTFELDWREAPKGIIDEGLFEGLPRGDWQPPSAPLPQNQRGFPADFYRREARRFELRSIEHREETRATVIEFLSYFPMFNNTSETWNHCRLAISSSLFADVKSKLYGVAEKRTLGFIRKKAHTEENPATRNVATMNVRTFQKQLVQDINKAMRNYAKPAKELLAHFLHEQLGNPYQPYSFDPAWRTADVTGLARGIEADRGFDRMNMLADALMEAGCEDEPMLHHLQEEREHQRGCWVLDLILGHDAELFAMEPLLEVDGTEGRHEPLGLAEPRNWDV